MIASRLHAEPGLSDVVESDWYSYVHSDHFPQQRPTSWKTTTLFFVAGAEADACCRSWSFRPCHRRSTSQEKKTKTGLRMRLSCDGNYSKGKNGDSDTKAANNFD